jgi:hypothetical protein
MNRFIAMSQRFICKVLLCVFSGSIAVSAGSTSTLAKTQKTQLTGYLVDVSCSRDEAEAGPGWGQRHTRACLLMPICVQSGYALLTSDNQVIRFDGKGNQQAHKLILATQQDKNWRIRVRGERADDEVKVSSIELIK